MSMSDVGWRRTLNMGAGLSVLSFAIMIVFVIPQVKNQPGMTHGGDLVLAGIQLLIAAVLIGIGFRHKREGCLTRILLLMVGVVAILMGLLGLLAVSQETEITLFWKTIRVCGINDIIIGILAIIACI